MAADINPDAVVETVDEFLLPETVPQLFASVGRPDIVVDAIDTVSAKIALAQFCQSAGILEIASMGGANKRVPTTLKFADIYETQVVWLARAFRKLARQAGVQQLTVLYSDELPVPVAPQPDAARGERTELGSHVLLSAHHGANDSQLGDPAVAIKRGENRSSRPFVCALGSVQPAKHCGWAESAGRSEVRPSGATRRPTRPQGEFGYD